MKYFKSLIMAMTSLLVLNEPTLAESVTQYGLQPWATNLRSGQKLILIVPYVISSGLDYVTEVPKDTGSNGIRDTFQLAPIGWGDRERVQSPYQALTQFLVQLSDNERESLKTGSLYSLFKEMPTITALPEGLKKIYLISDFSEINKLGLTDGEISVIIHSATLKNLSLVPQILSLFNINQAQPAIKLAFLYKNGSPVELTKVEDIFKFLAKQIELQSSACGDILTGQ